MFDDFTQSIDERWTQTCLGGGSLSLVNSAVRMELTSTQKGQYADAQIDDYGKRARSAFPWKPPLRMEVRARASLPAATATGATTASSTIESTSVESMPILRGTAGFGFWNYPFSVQGDILMLPEAVWFFYASPPSNMALVPNIPGWGWKAQVVHAMRPEALVATVPMALSAAWARITGETRPAARWLQRLSGAHETLLFADLLEWHTYALEWRYAEALFWVDGILKLRVPRPPTRPLGFVAWLDNQYAVATPLGVIRFGAVPNEQQWLEIDSISITKEIK